MGRRLRTAVHVPDPTTGSVGVHKAGTIPPDDVAERITNPAAWTDDGTDTPDVEPEVTLPTTPDELAEQQGGQPGEVEPAADGGQTAPDQGEGEVEVEIRATGSGWYEVVRGDEVLDRVRGKDAAEQVAHAARADR